MKTMPSCFLYSRDDELSARLTRIAARIAPLQAIANQTELEQALEQFGNCILFADLRAPNCFEVLAEIKSSYPLSIIVVMGADRSDPMLAAQWLDPFASTSLNPERRDFQTLLRHSVECLQLRSKNQALEGELTKLNAQRPEHPPPPRTFFTAPLQNFSKAQRNFDNLDLLFESVVEGLVATARVSRAGIFIKSESSGTYVFQAGTRCLATTEKLTIAANNSFVLWLEMNTHLISRKALENIPDLEERAMLKQMLDALGAEIIIPLHAAGQIKGWIFVGQRATGIPFEVADLEDLTSLADHISTTLEKAMQYEETALQKALAETLLHSIPFGILACDESATIRWFNSTVREILEPTGESVIGQPAEALGSIVADLLHRSLSGEEQQGAQEWTDPLTKRTLSAETRTLMDGSDCVGSMMMLHDITGAKLLQEKEEQLERATFWNELASSMSHEIRNPLVAIKTFSQLLPERYEDADFRAEFGEQVTAEVDRLSHIIDKISEFANPPKPIYQAMDVRKPIEHAVTRIQSEFDHENLKIHLSSDESPLQVNGDATSLEDCIYHLLMNAAENLDNKPGSRINVVVKSRSTDHGPPQVFVIISDNGSGIESSIREKVFSPFSTIKARGLGLGLPIAKRTVIDHNGQMDIETSSAGTTITLTLPAIDGEVE
jgi:signal transduction histidine kinase